MKLSTNRSIKQGNSLKAVKSNVSIVLYQTGRSGHEMSCLGKHTHQYSKQTCSMNVSVCFKAFRLRFCSKNPIGVPGLSQQTEITVLYSFKIISIVPTVIDLFISRCSTRLLK